MSIFGSVVDQYETARPGYPPELADAIADYHGNTPSRVVEIGAGTGKGTEVLVTLAAPLTCIEPDPRMATRLTDKFPQVHVLIGTFEQWRPPPGGVALLACAMAWHWLDPVTRNAKARAALAAGGTLALFGHRYGYADPDQAAAIYATLDTLDPTAKEPPADWMYHDVMAAGELTDVHVERFRRSLPLTRDEYLALVSTFGPFLARPQLQRRGLDALGRLVDDFGGTVTLEGFAATLAQRLAADTGRPVDWETVGRFGATARRVRHQLVPRLGDDLDLVVLLAGANDVMAGRSPIQWHDELTAILTDLTGRARQVVVAGIPPFTKFPALPATLARYLSERADALDQVSQRICAQNPDRTIFISSPTGQPPPEFFGSDRFHPSALGYRLWAEDLATRLTR